MPEPFRLISVPIEAGASRAGCALGAAALLAAGLAERLAATGAIVEQGGIVQPKLGSAARHANAAVHHLAEVAAWTAALADIAFEASHAARPIFLGGDHSLSAGTVAGLSRRAAAAGRPLFVLWLDAHPDFHTLDTTTSGNLHGIPLAYATGQPGFDGFLPALAAPLDPANICLLGVRSVDTDEAAGLARAGIDVHRPSRMGRGLTVLTRFLRRVEAADGLLHVSLDVDFLDPAIAPAVGTPVPDGVSLSQARRIAAMLGRSRLVSSLDLVELNPALDEHGRTARLMAELAATIAAPACAPAAALAA